MAETNSPAPESELTNIQKQVREIDTNLTALAWQNFLKRLINKVPENEARRLLIKEIQNYHTQQGKQEHNGKPPLLEDSPTQSVEELTRYLDGFLNPKKSYLANGLLRNLKDIEPSTQDYHTITKERISEKSRQYQKEVRRVMMLILINTLNSKEIPQKFFDQFLQTTNRLGEYFFETHDPQERLSRYEEAIKEVLGLEKNFRDFLDQKGITIKEKDQDQSYPQ